MNNGTPRRKPKKTSVTSGQDEKSMVLEFRKTFEEIYDFSKLGIGPADIKRMLKIDQDLYDYATSNRKKFESIFRAEDRKNGKTHYKDGYN